MNHRPPGGRREEQTDSRTTAGIFFLAFCCSRQYDHDQSALGGTSAGEILCLDGGEGEGQGGRSLVGTATGLTVGLTLLLLARPTEREAAVKQAALSMHVGGESGEVTSIIPLEGASTSAFGSLGGLDDLYAAPVLLHGHVAVPCCCPRTDLPVCKQQPSHQQRQAGQHEQVEGIG